MSDAMTKEIVEWLREKATLADGQLMEHRFADAADEIERLQREVRALTPSPPPTQAQLDKLRNV